jgi:hypothetical protein
VITLGIIATEEYIGPHGLRCMDCDVEIHPGDEVAERLTGMIEDACAVELICGKCGQAQSEAGP